MQTAVAADEGEVVWLLYFAFSGGDTYVCTASQDIDWNGETWEGIGGAIQATDALQETAELDAQGLPLQLSGVDQAIIQKALTELHAGRTCEVYLAHIDTDGTIIADPILVFKGLMNEGWSIDVNRDRESGGESKISTRIVSALARMQKQTGIQFNNVSYMRLTGSYVAFFDNVPRLATQKVTWGPRTEGSVKSGSANTGLFGTPWPSNWLDNASYPSQ